MRLVVVMASLVLSLEQEKQILQALKNTYPDSHGSSRAVFDGDDIAFDDIMDMLEENFNCDIHNCVIKLALGIGGQNQSNREIKSYIEYGDYYPLAKIYAYGRFIEIMEKVDKVDDNFRCYSDYSYYDLFTMVYGYEDPLDGERYVDYPEDADQKEIDEYETIFDTIYRLEELFGETDDNGQLGYNAEGNLVCYDYGFLVDSDEEWSSMLSVLLHKTNIYNSYLDICIENITTTNDIFEQLENQLCDKKFY